MEMGKWNGFKRFVYGITHPHNNKGKQRYMYAYMSKTFSPDDLDDGEESSCAKSNCC